MPLRRIDFSFILVKWIFPTDMVQIYSSTNLLRPLTPLYRTKQLILLINVQTSSPQIHICPCLEFLVIFLPFYVKTDRFLFHLVEVYATYRQGADVFLHKSSTLTHTSLSYKPVALTRKFQKRHPAPKLTSVHASSFSSCFFHSILRQLGLSFIFSKWILPTDKVQTYSSSHLLRSVKPLYQQNSCSHSKI